VLLLPGTFKEEREGATGKRKKKGGRGCKTDLLSGCSSLQAWAATSLLSQPGERGGRQRKKKKGGERTKKWRPAWSELNTSDINPFYNKPTRRGRKKGSEKEEGKEGRKKGTADFGDAF